eukprot:evm.model.scf_2770.1 EVM.evm.TU.scf_2770.1   scf_2770:14288-18841(-)
MGKTIAALKDRHVFLGLIGEFAGVLLFQFLAGGLDVVENSENYPDLTNKETVAILALGNGLVFAVLVYLVRHTSGGHLNPAITVAVTISGHMHILRGIFYILAQVLGGIAGALLSYAFKAGGSYCYDVEHDTFATGWQLFGWEAIMTFLLIMVVYSAVIAPGHGDIGPLVIGLTVTGCVWAGAPKSGAALNPARVIAPTIANMIDAQGTGRCHFGIFWYYIAAHAVAAVVAAVGALIVHGPGPHYTANKDVSRGRARGGIGQSLLESEGLQA